MKPIKQIIKTPKNHEVLIKIPDYVKEDELIEITITPQSNPDYEKKILQMKKSTDDPEFIKDLQTIANDFQIVDTENWDQV